MKNFKPAWWCRGAHAQTIFGGLFRATSPMTLTRKRFEIPDGDFLDIDFLKAPDANGKNAAPMVIILHGLEGSSNAPYVRSLLSEIQRRGWNAAAVNMRMCSGVPNRLKQTYHSGKTEDLNFVVNVLRKMNAAEKFYLVGFSLGGNLALKWLGEQGAPAAEKIEKAAAVSVPYDLVKAVTLMDRGFNRKVYIQAVLKRLKKKIAAKEKVVPGSASYEQIKHFTTLREFDSAVTAPLNGFKDAMDYWTRSSSRYFLTKIRVSTLLIHANDDPFLPGPMLPLEIAQNPEYLKLLKACSGGHLGFMAGPWPWQQTPWFENEIMNFFETKN